MYGLAAAALILATNPVQLEPVRERCEVIEVNHRYDSDGKHIFDQVIFWESHAGDDRDHVRAWRLLHHSPAMAPSFDRCRGHYRSVWQEGGKLRVVTAVSAMETWTQFDPEGEDRGLLPAERRRELRVARYEPPPPKP